jgi:hypothetical protein
MSWNTRFQQLRFLHFVAGHTIELQGLRTALLGGLCLALAAWQTLLALTGTADGERKPEWLLLLLIAWHLDDKLVVYYQKRMGVVSPRQPYRRWVALLAITAVFMLLVVSESRAASPIAFSALFLAGVQLHIGLISGNGYRRHYLAGAVVWCALSLVPLLELSPHVLRPGWLFIVGATLMLLGWRDHVVLTRALDHTEEACHA